jgi:hypothetical protein
MSYGAFFMTKPKPIAHESEEKNTTFNLATETMYIIFLFE